MTPGNISATIKAIRFIWGREMGKKVQLPIIQREAAIQSYDEKTRTAKMVFSMGAQVRRFDWDFGEFIEELSLDPAHVRLDRVRAGAVPFLKDHGGWAGPSIADVMGRIVDAKVDGQAGEADVLFSSRADVEPFVQDIRDGILRNVSVGYRVKKFEKAGEREGVPVLRATDWEVMEISSVAINADMLAQFRSATSEGPERQPKLFSCEVRGMEQETVTEVTEKTVVETEPVTQDEKTTGEQTMTEEQKRALEIEAQKRAEEAKKEGVKAERERQAQIRAAVRAAKLEDSVAEELIASESSVDAARAEVLKRLADADAARATSSVRFEAGSQDEVGTRRAALSEAILHRGAPDSFKLTERAREFAGLTLLEMARESLRRSGVKVGGMSVNEVASRAMHSTSDFPEITADIINKSLRQAFMASPQTFAPIVRRVQNPDFKQISRVQLGMGSELKELAEGAEIEHGTVGEAAEKYTIKEYARALSISRKTIINDDLDAFVRLPAAMGVKARSLESKLVWQIFTANANMADGFALFSSQHGNQAGAPAAIDLTTLGAARSAMRKQKDMDGEPLTLAMRWLIVPVALETVAEQFVSQIQPNQSSQVNPFGPGGRSQLGIIVEPRLDDDSLTKWYGASSLDQVDMLELATLSGTTEPEVLSEEMFDTLGMKFRVVHSVGVKAIDWRGLYRNS